jgi:hypothetical protein
MSPQHGMSLGCGWRDGLQLWKVSVDTLNKQPWTDDKGWSFGLCVGCGANNFSPQKNKIVTKILKEPQTWMDSLDKRPKRWNRDMRFGTTKKNLNSMT